MAKNWKPSEKNDDVRAAHASTYGGFELYNEDKKTQIRSALGILLKKAGQKILSGDFNLTRISFPIQCMNHKSALETMTMLHSTMPVYLNYANSITDPVERMKIVIAQAFSYQIYEKVFDKPLNPILGETYESEGQDGAKIYLEQTSHHPPTSHYLIEGPDGNYKVTGYLEFAINSGLTAATVICKGYKQVTFKDGHTIKYNHNDDSIYGLFMGSFGHQLIGKVEFEDKQNNIKAYINYTGYTFKKQDYCWGELFVDGARKHEIVGNYMGYLDFDGVRYWDYREKNKVHFTVDYEAPADQTLESQCTKRTDGIFLQTKTIDEAQEEKERLEDIQRTDRKGREKAEARRKDGGAKYPTESA